MPKLLAITPYPSQSADTRYRISQYIPYLQNYGWQVTLKPFMNSNFYNMYNQKGKSFEKAIRTIFGFINRLPLSFQAKKYDAVLVHKEVFPFGPPLFEKIMVRSQQNLLYDMDDAFWTHPPQFEQLGKRLRDPKKIQKIIQMSSIILAGNKFIAEYAQKYSQNVIHFPTVLDTDYYEPRNEVDDGFITIGWVGRWSSQSYLESLLPVFTDLIKKYQNLKFRFIGVSSDFSLLGVPFERINWKLQNEITDFNPH